MRSESVVHTFLALFTVISFAISTSAQEPTIKDLDGIIGSWEVEEVGFSGTNQEPAEQGTRTCSYILLDTYILCETRSRFLKTGKERAYQFLINYNGLDKRFELVSIYSNWGRKNFDAITIQSNPKRWDLRGTPRVENGIERRVWGVIEFMEPNRYVWTVRINKSTDAPTEWPIMFREVARRKKN